MAARRLTRSRVFRAVALGAAVAPLGVAWALASCILADPPAGLPVYATTAPMVTLTYPPAGLLTNWPTGPITFVAQVQVQNPIDGVNFAFVVDQGRPGQDVVTDPSADQLPPGNGGVIFVAGQVPHPTDTNCHTITLNLDAVEDKGWSLSVGTPGEVAYTQGLGTSVVWTYAPAGSSAGNCPVFDAGGAPDVHTDVNSDTIIIPVDASKG